MTISIPDDLAEQAHLSAPELRIDLAAYLYQRERLSMGQARRLAGLALIPFQHELAKRDIAIQLNADDFEKDLQNLSLR